MPETYHEDDWKDPELPVGYLSPSAVELYLLCPRAYEFRYIQKLEDPKINWKPVEGSSVHAVLETNNLHKIESGEDLEKEDLVERWGDEWSDRSKEITDWEDAKTDEIHKRGKVFIERYRSYVAPKVTPLSAEQEVRGEIEGVPIKAYIDLVREGEVDPVVTDYKVSKRAKTESALASSIQMGVYSILEETPLVEYVCFVRTKSPSLKTVKGSRMQSSLDRTANAIKGVSEAIKKGSFPYCNPESWKCCSLYCGYWYACPQGGKR